jgi:regulator of protease activity HflC (stomatin/prohibitin superfamily)
MNSAVNKTGAEHEGDAWAQSAELSFRFLFAIVAVLGIGWAISNCRQVPADSRAVVLRFGSVVREASAGLLLALPRPFEHVIVLPAANRPIEFDVADNATHDGISVNPRDNTALWLTGDMSVVRLRARFFYEITDANAYVLSAAHVVPALGRVFATSALAVTARRDLDTILVARPERNVGSDRTRVGRESLRGDLVAEMNRRLDSLAKHGVSLGVRVSRMDLLPAIPAEAKAAFDSVLFSLQQAQTGIAQARTQAEMMLQKANQERDRMLTDAQARGEEQVTQARARTAAILALSTDSQGLSSDLLARQLYQEQIVPILGQAGKVFSADAAGATRLILPAGEQH